MPKAAFLAVVPDTEKRTVTTPRRKANAAYRSREHLTEAEVERLIAAAKDNRYGHRDATMILARLQAWLTRPSELVSLRWDPDRFRLRPCCMCIGGKNGTPATHPLTGDELRALRKLKRRGTGKSPFVFVSERKAPFSASAVSGS